jgi:hypothetical protein
MEEPIQPAVVAQTAAPEIKPVSRISLPDAQVDYDRLLSYFKYLVTLTTVFIGLCVAAAGTLFYSKLSEVRDDAKSEATRVATLEAKDAVSRAFNEKNINDLILKAAQEKVGTITDQMIQRQLIDKLRPVQQRFAQVTRISECEMRMRLGFRAGLDDLNGILKNTSDPEVLQFGKSSLATVSQDFDTRVTDGVRDAAGGNALYLLDTFLSNEHRVPDEIPRDLSGVVKLIRHDADLNAVAPSFAAFREMSGANVKMFDVAAVESWCEQNKPRCQASK